MPASLAACAEFFIARGVAAEIIVADDGSTDATPKAFADAVSTLPRGHLDYRYLGLAHRGQGVWMFQSHIRQWYHDSPPVISTTPARFSDSRPNRSS